MQQAWEKCSRYGVGSMQGGRTLDDYAIIIAHVKKNTRGSFAWTQGVLKVPGEIS
jgi:hypothetical protein